MKGPGAFLVLGMGNELFTDEGLGVRAARHLETLGLDDVDVIDGGTLGLSLLSQLEGRRGLLVLDAIAARGVPPGTIVELSRDELLQPRRILLSAHQVGVSETLTAASFLGDAPEHVAAVGMVPFSMETGYGLSAGAEAALSELVTAALGVLRLWGVKVTVDA